MATERRSSCVWEGGLSDGAGRVTFESSGVIKDLDVTWAARTEEPGGKTSPEELIAAAHAACFSMQFSHELEEAIAAPQRLEVQATVGFEVGKGITGVRLDVTGSVPGATQERFASVADSASKNCPVSSALSIPITVEANLSG